MDRSLAEKLKAVLQGDDVARKKDAIRVLARSLDPDALVLLTDTCRREKNPEIKELARKAVKFLEEKLGERLEAEAATSGEKRVLDRDRLRELLKSGDLSQRIKAALAVIQYRDERFLEEIIVALESETSAQAKALFIRAIGQIGTNLHYLVPLRYLDDPDPLVRAAATEAILHLRNPQGYPYILKMLMDREEGVRKTAAILVREMKEEIYKLLESMLSSDAVWMRDAAAYTLSAIANEACLPLLKRASTDKVETVRAKASEGLRRLADKGVEEAARLLKNLDSTLFAADILDIVLTDSPISGVMEEAGVSAQEIEGALKGLQDEDPHFRMIAIDKITGSGIARYANELAALLDREPDEHVRSFLLVSIARLGGRDFIGTISKYLSDEDRRVRANAVEALGLIGDESITLLLRPYLKNEDHRIRANAIVALSRFNETGLVEALETLVDSPKILDKLAAIYAVTAAGKDELIPSLLKIAATRNTLASTRAAGAISMLAKKSSYAGRVLKEWEKMVMKAALPHFRHIYTRTREQPELFSELVRIFVEHFFSLQFSRYLYGPLEAIELSRLFIESMGKDNGTMLQTARAFIDRAQLSGEKLPLAGFEYLDNSMIRLLDELDRYSSSGRGRKIKSHEEAMITASSVVYLFSEPEGISIVASSKNSEGVTEIVDARSGACLNKSFPCLLRDKGVYYCEKDETVIPLFHLIWDGGNLNPFSAWSFNSLLELVGMESGGNLKKQKLSGLRSIEKLRAQRVIPVHYIPPVSVTRELRKFMQREKGIARVSGSAWSGKTGFAFYLEKLFAGEVVVSIYSLKYPDFPDDFSLFAGLVIADLIDRTELYGAVTRFMEITNISVPDKKGFFEVITLISQLSGKKLLIVIDGNFSHTRPDSILAGFRSVENIPGHFIFICPSSSYVPLEFDVVLELPPLSEEEGRELAGGNPEPFRIAGGNPFFLSILAYGTEEEKKRLSFHIKERLFSGMDENASRIIRGVMLFLGEIKKPVRFFELRKVLDEPGTLAPLLRIWELFGRGVSVYLESGSVREFIRNEFTDKMAVELASRLEKGFAEVSGEEQVKM